MLKFLSVIMSFLAISTTFAMGKRSIYVSKKADKKLSNPTHLEVIYDLLDGQVKPFEDQRGKILAIGQLVDSQDNPLCSATLVGNSTIATAKHCLEGGVVLFGVYFKTDNGLKAAIKNVKMYIKEKKDITEGIHPDLHAAFTNAYEDIVIAQLDKNLGEKITPFYLYKGNNYKKFEGQKFLYSGYPQNNGVVGPKFISKKDCELVQYKDSIITTNCMPRSGISGGPFFYYSEKSKRYVLMGVLSSAIQYNADQIFGSTWATFGGVLKTENMSLLPGEFTIQGFRIKNP